jgi:hypothetical protein
MKKTTQNSFSKQPLSKRLAQYGALTIAIAGVTDANGQIEYTDITPDFNGGINSDYALDLNNDGTDDFQITQSQPYSYPSFSFLVNRLAIRPLDAANETLVDNPSAGAYAYPFALDSGGVISSGQATWNNNGFGSSSFQSLNWASTYYGSLYNDGNFVGVADKFIGLRFNISGQTHYGWVRLDVSADATVWAVKDYAYNSVAGEPINAGQTTLGIAEHPLNEIKIVNLNSSIALYNLPEKTDYNLYDISGKSVLNGSINDHTFVIEANGISNGIYIIELTDALSKAVIRKKVIL